MDTSTTSIEGGSKKVPLEDLTKEDLIKKCRGLLQIAQKAKQARDAIAEENSRLRNAPNVSEEFIESFTEQKLQLVTTIDELKTQKKLLEKETGELRSDLDVAEDKLAQLDTENQGIKRQVVRLTEENEQLLTHLYGLEGQIDELKKIGLEQQQQLLTLEQNNEVLAANASTIDNNSYESQVNELQKMLAVSLEEVKKLKEGAKHMEGILCEKETMIINLNDSLTSYDFNTLQIDEYKQELEAKDIELAKQTAIIDDLNTEVHKNRALTDKLKQDISNTSKRFNENQIESSGINAVLQNNNEKLKEKLKSYHGKIVKLAGDVRKVKESKDYILEIFKVYNQQVNEWKVQLTTISLNLRDELTRNSDERTKLYQRIHDLEKEINILSKQHMEIEGNTYINEIKVLKDQHELDEESIQKLKEDLKEMKNVLSDNENLHHTIDVMRSQITKLQGDNGNIEIQLKKIQELEASNALLKESVDLLKSTHEESMATQCDINKIVDNVKENLESKAIECLMLQGQIEKLQNDFKIKDDLLKQSFNESHISEDIKSSLEKKNSEFNELYKQLISKNEDYEKLYHAFQELQIKYDTLSKDHNENVSLIQELNVKVEYYNKLQQELNNLKAQHASVHNQLESALQAQKDAIELVDRGNEEIKILKDTLESEKCADDQEKQALETKFHQLTERFNSEKAVWEASRADYETTIECNTRLGRELKKAIEKLENDVESSRTIEAKHAEQTSELILELRQTNKALEDKINELQLQLQTNIDNQPTADVATLKRENAELLAEMNVMNQALKERGETISQQQAHCDEMLKKIQIYEGQLAKSQENVQHLQDEIQSLRNQNSQDDCDALSTSTISRSDEINRMKELEGSWEERYGKLRTYALKLKAKAKEMQQEMCNVEAEKSELQNRVTSGIKIVQSMQGQVDVMQDKLDSNKEDKHKLDQAIKDNQRLIVQISNSEETILKLKQQLDGLNQEKTNLDAWKKQVGTKVQALKKELEANIVMRKDYENRIQKLQSDIASKDKELSAEKDKHSSTRSQLHESNNECKKQSVLNLEIQDYERSIKELSTKLERKNEQVNKLKNQNDSQKSSVNATKEQNRLIEEKCTELETDLDACRIEIRTFKKQIADLEVTIVDKDNKIDEVREVLEATRCENEDLSTQLSRIIAEHQKVNQIMREEKDHFRNENVDLEQRVRKLEDQLKLRCDELTNVNSEYQSYKVRAQSVLRQNQSRDVGVEEKLSEEAASLRAQIQICQGEIEELKSTLKEFEATNAKLNEERNLAERTQKEIQQEYDNTIAEMDKVNMKYQQTIQEHSETVRSLKLHTETLSQCYRQQISEQEVRHNREIIELQSKYDKTPLPHHEIPSLLIPTMAREEGEGSESVDSNNGNTIHPLEKLLGADQDQEIVAIKKQLSENEMRVVHLTALLADTEQDLSKHMQMNKLLKDEIRRQQRSVERERHAENLEYMKNVVFKFITLSNGDERLRLVPVLNTILKLSPEETNKLNMVAKGDKSWSTYLPMWPGASTSKPQ